MNSPHTLPVAALTASETTTKATTQVPPKLGLSLLVALVVGSIIGSGIFGLPQNMAAGAGAGAILIGWTITGIGMLLLVRVYQMLSLRKPELDNGVYAYARALSGEYVGFNSAWGYWVSAWIGNVGYLVAAFGAGFLILGGGLYIIFGQRVPEATAFREIDEGTLDEDERTIYNLLKKREGSMYQSDLIRETGMSKVQMTRVLDKMAGKKIVDRARRGMTNIVVLK